MFKPSNDYSNILFVRLVVSFVLQNGFQNGGTVEQTKETIENGQKKWTDDEVQDLNKLLEEKPCLWDMFSNEYTKREVKERAYAELAEHVDSSSAIVKAKINALRAKLGREMAKESNTNVIMQQTKSTLANGCFMNNSSF